MTKEEEKLEHYLNKIQESVIDIENKIQDLTSNTIYNGHMPKQMEVGFVASEYLVDIFRRLAQLEYKFASFYKDYILSNEQQDNLHSYANKLIIAFEEKIEIEKHNEMSRETELNLELRDVEQEQYEEKSESEFCPICDESPCACSDRDN
jgi:hypothetical protein